MMQFTRKLSHDEQRQLSEEDWQRYWNWLLAYNAPLSARWARREYGHSTEEDKMGPHDYYIKSGGEGKGIVVGGDHSGGWGD